MLINCYIVDAEKVSDQLSRVHSVDSVARMCMSVCVCGDKQMTRLSQGKLVECVSVLLSETGGYS